MAQPKQWNVGGHIYEERDGQYVLVDSAPMASPAQAGGLVIKPADSVERALKAAELAAKAREAARAPLDDAKARAEAARATAEAALAQSKVEQKPDPRTAQAMEDLNNDATFRAIQQAQGDAGLPRTTGWWSYLHGLPGTNAQLLNSDLSTINADNMLGRLKEMKQQSPTGASGMGALSDTEGRILRDSIANLDQSLPHDRLVQNLKFIEQHYRRAAAIARGVDPDRMDATSQTVLPPVTDANQTLSRNGTKSVVDPTLKALSAKIGGMIADPNISDQEILDYAKQSGFDPAGTTIQGALARRNGKQWQEYHRKYPNRGYPMDPSVYTRQVPLTPLASAINTGAQSGYGAGTVAAAEAMTGNHLDNIAGAMGGNAEQVRAGEELLRQEHPYASTAGDIAGQVADEAMLGRIPGAHALLASRWGRRGADALYGAVSGQGASDDDPGAGAILGGILNAGGGMAGRNLQRGTGLVVGGMRDQTLRSLNRSGIPMTIGQIARSGSDLGGKIAAGIEDRLAGYPIVGDAIKSARLRGSQGLNRAAFNEGLAPIGRDTGRLTGSAAVDNMQDATRQAYSDALDGVTLPHDLTFGTDYAAAKNAAAAIPVHGPQIVHTLENTVEPYFANGNLSGENLQAALQRLRSEASTYNGLPGGKSASDAFGQVEDALHGLVQRQAPDVMPRLQAANTAYRNQQILQNATNGAKDELFTPFQLRRASISNTKSFGGANQAASTDRPFYDLARNAQEVLPSTTPDSGTAGRWLIPAGATALAGGFGASTAEDGDRAGKGARDAAIGLGVAGALMSPYSKGGQKALQALLLGQRIKMITAAGDLIRNNPQLLGTIGAAYGREQVYPTLPPQ